MTFRMNVVALSSVLFSNFAAADYTSGLDLLAKYSDIVKTEQGASVLVPVDYNNPKSGRFPVYYHVAGTFDIGRPSILIFVGGPGSATHFGADHKINVYSKMPFNFILMDQRGIGFSKPNSDGEYKNSEFYSSENTARDANEIRKALKIEKFIAYGGSYGTVPATLFGMLFPLNTTAVVLEGTFFSGYEFYSKSPFLIELNLRFFRSLNVEGQKRVLEISKMSPGMIADLLKAYVMSYGERGLGFLKQKIANSKDADDFLKQISPSGPVQSAIPEELRGDSMAHNVLSCKELGIGVEGLSITITYQEGGPEWFRGLGSNWYIDTCKSLGLFSHPPLNFSALKVQVPVIYLQGQMDPATLSEGALAHFSTIPKGAKAFVQFEGLGHTPIGQFFAEGQKQQVDYLLSDFLPKIFNGRTDLGVEVQKLNALGSLKVRSL